MPIEIRELVINVNANQPQQSGGSGSSAPPSQQTQTAPMQADKMVADAVEQVLDLIRNRKER